jgi:hypothetical protein
MAMGKRVGQMEQCMRETISLERNKARETSNGLMGQSTLDSSSTIISKAWESTGGQMEGAIMVNGVIIRCMAKEYSHGLMEEDMKGNTLRIRSKEWEYSTGQMDASM